VFVLANVLQPLIDLNEAILRFWHDTVGFGWGMSIIGLTIVIRLAILPLTFKQVRSMQEMQRFSPEMQRIRERYKDDKQRQQEELMKLYQEHGFNPLSSCLPLLLQLPFFFGLYQTLRSAEFQKEVGDSGQFLAIPDITEPLTGHTGILIFMIVLYVSTQLASSYVSSLNVQDKNQRRLLFIFPFIFVPVVINFEAGLLIYWITTNVFTVSQQLVIRKFLPPPEPHAPKDEKADAKAEPRQSRKRPTTQPAVAGDGKAAGKAAKARSSGNGKSDGGPAKPPPRSPRKKKKRSGRRR
jgi:YidC/Oxa1 family membrane protein insertase